MFITPMSEMIAEMMRLCDDWDSAVDRGDIAVPDMLLNDTMAQNSLGIIKKFIRELQGKIDDSKLGVYRHRVNEWQNRKKETPDLKAEKKSKSSLESAKSIAARSKPILPILLNSDNSDQTDEQT